ncbi:MAG: hypothetical protein K0U68_08765 [Gammaproteobacteria bacterium]|nr:hypothetical protein [Gammaproteobacteria bacterium]
MSENPDLEEQENLESLRKLVAIVYMCQVLAFALAGIPLIIGLAINFYYRQYSVGTWLESHFKWQITSSLILLTGVVVSGLTLSMGIGLHLITPFVMLFVYQLGSGWFALNANRAVGHSNRFFY